MLISLHSLTQRVLCGTDLYSSEMSWFHASSHTFLTFSHLCRAQGDLFDLRGQLSEAEVRALIMCLPCTTCPGWATPNCSHNVPPLGHGDRQGHGVSWAMCPGCGSSPTACITPPIRLRAMRPDRVNTGSSSSSHATHSPAAGVHP